MRGTHTHTHTYRNDLTHTEDNLCHTYRDNLRKGKISHTRKLIISRKGKICHTRNGKISRTPKETISRKGTVSRTWKGTISRTRTDRDSQRPAYVRVHAVIQTRTETRTRTRTHGGKVAGFMTSEQL